MDCLLEKEYAEQYLRELTDTVGIISTKKAQEVISNSIMRIFPEINSNDEVTILFEKDSAVPLYYATQTYKTIYNWNGIFPENVYNVWRTTTDLKTQRTMVALYGQPYTQKEVWEIFDSDLNEAGVYNSLEKAKEILLEQDSNTEKTAEKKAVENQPMESTSTANTKNNTDGKISAKHILVENYDTAKELSERLKNGEDFDTHMHEYTIDPGTEKNPNGYTFVRGDMINEFEDAAFANVGEISDIVKTDYGYHIIKRIK